MPKLNAIAFALLLTAVPTELERDYVLDTSEPWGGDEAAARIRFDSHRPLPSDDDHLTLHTATVLGIFKSHSLLPLPAERVTFIERRGFMYSEDGDWPCWDNEQPIPVGTEAMVFLRWHPDLRAFWLGSIRSASLPMASRKCQ